MFEAFRYMIKNLSMDDVTEDRDLEGAKASIEFTHRSCLEFAVLTILCLAAIACCLADVCRCVV